MGSAGYDAGHSAAFRAAQFVYRRGPRLLLIALLIDLAGLVVAVRRDSTGWITALAVVLAVDVVMNVLLRWKRRRPEPAAARPRRRARRRRR